MRNHVTLMHDYSVISASAPVDPVLRLPVQVGDGENDSEIALLHVDEGVGETPNQASLRTFVKSWPSLRKALDLINREEDLPQKLVSKPRLLTVVLVNPGIQLQLGDLEEANAHLLR